MNREIISFPSNTRIETRMGTMGKPRFISPKPIFDTPTIEAILTEADLSLAEGSNIPHLQESLEKIAVEHYWQQSFPPHRERQSGGISFDALADPSVTPSRLKKRLEQITGSSNRVFAGKANRPLAEKIEQLLNHLGRARDGGRLKYSGTEAPGHSGSERAAVWLCLVRAVNVYERPPLGYRSGDLLDRPWASQQFESAIQTLVACIRDPERGREAALEAARAIHRWAGWSVPRVDRLMAPDKKRHKGEFALAGTIRALALVYASAFGEKPSAYKPFTGGAAPRTNPWILFLRAVLGRILGADECPSNSALEARWRRQMSDFKKSI